MPQENMEDFFWERISIGFYVKEEDASLDLVKSAKADLRTRFIEKFGVAPFVRWSAGGKTLIPVGLGEVEKARKALETELTQFWKHGQSDLSLGDSTIRVASEDPVKAVDEIVAQSGGNHQKAISELVSFLKILTKGDKKKVLCEDYGDRWHDRVEAVLKLAGKDWPVNGSMGKVSFSAAITYDCPFEP